MQEQKLVKFTTKKKGQRGEEPFKSSCVCIANVLQFKQQGGFYG